MTRGSPNDMTSSERYIRLVCDEVWQVLKPRGFRRRGQTFSRESSEAFEIVNVQKSTDSTHEAAKLTVNLGVYYKIVDDLFGRPPQTKPMHYDCQYQTRLGRLLEPPEDRWWTMSSDMEVEAAANEILYAVETAGLRALEAVGTLLGAKAALTAGMGNAYLRGESFRRFLAGDPEPPKTVWP